MKTQRMEITEYLDGNDSFGLKVKYPPVDLRGVWVDSSRMFDGVPGVCAEVAHGQILLSVVGHTFPKGNRNVKVVYLADVPVKDAEAKILVLKLGLNGRGPWMMFPFNEDMTGLLTTVKELQEDVIANDDELTIRYAQMTQKEIDDASEFPGW